MLVMKFGGTSVECAESILRVGKIVRGRIQRQPVVVVSALARVTDQLQSMGRLSCAGGAEEALEHLAQLESRHRDVACRLLPAARCSEVLGQILAPSFEEARAVLKAVSAISELSQRTLDRLLSFGEHWSSLLVTESFKIQGLSAVLVDSRNVVITDANHSQATPLMDVICERLARDVLPCVEAGSVPVMGGFIGATMDGIPTTLGRGGSDFTASIVGSCLKAESIEIWTDVDGMMTADPRICPQAHNIDSIGFEEAAELAHFGAKVLHPKTLQPAVEQSIPVYVLNSRRPENSGTRVDADVEGDATRVKSIACKRGIVLAEVLARQGLDARLTASIFQAVEEQKCLVDLAAMSRTNLSLLLSSLESASALATSLESVAEVRITPDLALVSLVGQNVARDPAISARALNSLPGLPVRMIFHGASDMSLSFVVAAEYADLAVRALHLALFSPPSFAQNPAQLIPVGTATRESVAVGEV